MLSLYLQLYLIYLPGWVIWDSGRDTDFPPNVVVNNEPNTIYRRAHHFTVNLKCYLLHIMHSYEIMT